MIKEKIIRFLWIVWQNTKIEQILGWHAFTKRGGFITVHAVAATAQWDVRSSCVADLSRKTSRGRIPPPPPPSLLALIQLSCKSCFSPGASDKSKSQVGWCLHSGSWSQNLPLARERMQQGREVQGKTARHTWLSWLTQHYVMCDSANE